MYTTTELEENSKMVKASTDSFEEIWASVVSRYLATLCDSDRVSAALELERMLKEITSVDDSAALSGFKLLFNTNKVNERSGVLEALDTRQLQRLIDDVFSALQARKVGVVLLSEFLARIWLSTRLLPSEVKMIDIKTASLYPFATTPTSNVFEGILSDGTRVAMKTCRQSQSQPASVEHIKRFFFEALVSSTTNHRNILPSLGLYIDRSPNVYLVSKFQKHGSLPQYLLRNPAVPKLPMVGGALSFKLVLTVDVCNDSAGASGGGIVLSAFPGSSNPSWRHTWSKLTMQAHLRQLLS
ncbi:hypothetical protein H0H93_000674 [Arthromyces matolae]|nr:hypothetical protein H0H93_000674 [Arthromyces matolae]